jgi:hypothetical protein
VGLKGSAVTKGRDRRQGDRSAVDVTGLHADCRWGLGVRREVGTRSPA